MSKPERNWDFSKFQNSTAFLALVMGAIAMGVSPVFVREAGVGPFASAFWRTALALPFLIMWAAQETEYKNWRMWLPRSRAAVLGGIFFAGDLIFWHLSILNTSVANAALMACLAPVWVALFSKTFLGESVSGGTLFGLGLCLLGAALLLGTSFATTPENILGDLYGVGTSIFFGLYFIAIRSARKEGTSGVITLSTTIITTLILLLFALAFGGSLFPDTLTHYASLLSLGLITHAGGQGLLTVALGSLSAIFSSLVIFLEAIAAAVFGWLFYNEQLSLGQYCGGALIVLGIWVGRPQNSS